MFAVLTACAAQARAQTVDIRVSHQWVADTDARDRAARIFAAEAAKRAPNLKFSVHPNSELGIPPFEQYDALLDGRIEAAIFPLFYVSSRIPELSVTLLPGLPANVEQANLLRGSEFHRRLQEFTESKGIHLLTWWWLQGGLVSTDDEIGGAESMNGVHVRSGDALFDLMFERVGAVPMRMPSTEIIPMMEAGRLNIAQASLETLLSMRMQSVAKSAVIGGNALYVSLHPLMISAKIWKSLGDAERKAMMEAAEIADRDFAQSQSRIDTEARASFVAAGVKTRPMSFAEYEGWIKLANQTSWAAYRKQGPTSADLLQSMMTSLMNATSASAKK